MVNSKKALFISLTVSCALIVLGVFYLSEAHGLWTKYRSLWGIRSFPYEAYVRYIIPFMEKYNRLFPIYVAVGLAFSISGVWLFIFSFFKLYKLSRLLK